ncbi:lysosomal alpha-N-acetyl glucosaminidase [Pelomyxa schiedti]|nr:lysosomal alpha-N-acetyl glucosaminidase [Pelomyxa schiedti]
MIVGGPKVRVVGGYVVLAVGVAAALVAIMGRGVDSYSSSVDAVTGLISRVMSRRDASCGPAPTFALSLVDAFGADDAGAGVADSFSVWSDGGSSEVNVEGTSGVALASGFHWYLKYYAMCSISWLGDQLCLPDISPKVEKFTMESPYEYGYYMNTCTLGYSTVWWDWDRWEQEIDWMAMNGVNLPLAFVGQEYIWQQVYNELGIPFEDLDDFFGGPAFLPWQRMGNVDGWPSPLSSSWMQKQKNLQLQILERMRSFDMRPILPGFSGHVPRALTTYYPGATVTQLSPWADGFNGTFFLDPFDPLFAAIGELLMTSLAETFGTDHIYNCDPFNENTPPSNDPDYLSQVAKAIYSSMAATDPEALWVLQGWFLVNDADFWQPPQVEAFLNAIDDSQMLILDLFAEERPIWNTGLFFGKPFIWNMLQNFGGRPGMFAAMDNVAQWPLDALSNTTVDMVGTGFTPEAIETNPVVYDLMSEMHWRTSPFDLDLWVEEYAVRRYGADSASAKQAWSLLQHSIFNCNTTQEGPSAIIAGGRPDVRIERVGCCATTEIYWDPKDVCDAWDLLLRDSDTLKSQATYRNDLAQVTLQVLSSIMTNYWRTLVSSFYKSDASTFEQAAQNIETIIAEMDQILATQDAYLLGKWLSAAKSWGDSEDEQLVYQYNARLQITLWSLPLTSLNDYAYKMWAGLTRTFQLSRWQTFIDDLRPFVSTPSLWDRKAYLAKVGAVEEDWTLMTDDWNYSTTPTGDAVAIATSLRDKYLSQC